jgi:sugar phosphate isomerase/epimerase
VFKCLGPARIGLQLPWAEVYDLAARHGFQGVELTTSVLDAPPEERRQVATDLDARGLRAGGFSLPLRFDRDEAEYAAGSPACPAVRRRLRSSGRAGAPPMCGPAPTSSTSTPTWSSMPTVCRSPRLAHVNDAPVGVALEELIDMERLLPGASGVFDARAFLTVLDEIGFDGPALVEPVKAEVRALAPEERVAAVAASLESVWP